MVSMQKLKIFQRIVMILFYVYLIILALVILYSHLRKSGKLTVDPAKTKQPQKEIPQNTHSL